MNKLTIRINLACFLKLISKYGDILLQWYLDFLTVLKRNIPGIIQSNLTS